MRGSYHGVAALLALLVVQPAAAAPAGVGFAGGAGTTLEKAVLVGRGGEIYRREGTVWRRSGGGVATDLLGVWGRAPEALLAIGAATPVYRFDGKSWTTIAGSWRGPALLAARDAPRAGLAVGARVFLLEAGRWTPAPNAPARVSALYTRAARDALLISEGKLYQLGRRGWQPVALPEPASAVGGREPLVLGAGGGVYRVSGGRARALAVGLAGFRARQLFGAMVAGDATLARFAGGKLVEIGAAPAADLAVLLELDGGTLLAATRDGRVFTGTPPSWTEEAVDPTVSADHAAPGAPPAPIAPPASR